VLTFRLARWASALVVALLAIVSTVVFGTVAAFRLVDAPVAVAEPFYRDLLLKSGYVLARKDGNAEIYAWRENR
jgi:ABC-type enterochelin transport system permease subunit